MIGLDLAKQHLRVDGDEEDEHIEFLLAASIKNCLAYLNCSVYGLAEDLEAAILNGDEHAILLTEDIKAAMLLTLGHLYANREDVVVGGGGASALPMNSRWLLDSYRKRPGV